MQSQTRLCSGRNESSISKSKSVDSVLLSTAVIEIAGINNKYHRARALLDSGSQHCIISESVRSKINSYSIQSAYQIVGVGQTVSQSAQLCEVKLRSLNDNYQTNIKCFVLPVLTNMIPTFKIDSNLLNIPKEISFADPTYYAPSRIDLILGVDVFWDLILEGRIRLSNGPYLQNTKLGWIVAGPIAFEHRRIIPVQCNFTQTLEIGEQLRKFWEIEEISHNNNLYTHEDKVCEKLFIDTTKRLKDGRFSVRIPLKESTTELGNSYEVAKNRFLSLERKLERNVEYKQMYHEFINEYIGLGHMTRVAGCPQPNYFLPHHGVVRDDSVTTKLRVVFNASQPTSSGKSLNDIQMTGPPLQSDLFALLLRFRQYQYVACADIEKMFRQVLVQEDQRNLQMILWRESPSEPLLHISSTPLRTEPRLHPNSMRCVRQLGHECTSAEIAHTILNNFYVDDYLVGHNNKTELVRICKGVIDVCKSGCFPLRKWIFNSDEIAKEVAQDDNCQSKHFTLNENKSYKTLGLDASENAYGVCAYSRTFSETGELTVRMICSKSRVAPVKSVSIPRLELCGAVIGAKLFNRINSILPGDLVTKTYLWSDSTIVLCWINMSPHLLKPFVKNRVIEINELTSNATWRHVDGKINPADLLTRGLYIDELSKSSLWWNGPAFLHEQITII
ncbi:hypothetical protein evm_011519 [Chilo suppressalis]|nr:hypothetical protein evm_011519 [Chilo suppressalis]